MRLLLADLQESLPVNFKHEIGKKNVFVSRSDKTKGEIFERRWLKKIDEIQFEIEETKNVPTTKILLVIMHGRNPFEEKMVVVHVEVLLFAKRCE